MLVPVECIVDGLIYEAVLGWIGVLVESLRNGVERIHALPQGGDLIGIEYARKVDIAVTVEGLNLLFERREGV